MKVKFTKQMCERYTEPTRKRFAREIMAHIIHKLDETIEGVPVVEIVEIKRINQKSIADRMRTYQIEFNIFGQLFRMTDKITYQYLSILPPNIE